MNYSVIIPAYNCESSIANTVKSICNVQVDEMEIIIVDDGSTDCTRDVCESLIRQYPFIKYYYQKNQGVSTARNLGISKSVGKYIMFLDSDDQVNSAELKKCMRTAVEQDVDILIFGMAFYRLYKGALFQIEDYYCEKEEKIFKSEIGNRMVELFENNYLSSVCNKIIKSDIAHQVIFNSSKMCFEDLLYSLELLQYCDSIYVMPDIAYIYRVEHSSRKTAREKRINDFNEYMLDFQSAVLKLEKHIGMELTAFRLKIGLIYEWLLMNKLQSSIYRELKQLDKDKMNLVLFGKEYVSSTKISKLFFDNKIIALRLYSIYWNIRHKTSLRIRCIKYRHINKKETKSV